VMMSEPFDLLGSIRNAGAIFLGPWTPESVGDYVAGPNHVLPTGGTARFSSPLSVDDFMKKSSVLSYSYEALEMDGDTVIEIATREGLWAHGRAVSLRLEAVEEYVDEFEILESLEGELGVVDDRGSRGLSDESGQLAEDIIDEEDGGS
jgi:hypothetical protein